MKNRRLYRAIEFYKLQFSLSEDSKELWAYLSEKKKMKQWWTSPDNVSHVETVLSDIATRRHMEFIENSKNTQPWLEEDLIAQRAMAFSTVLKIHY